MEEINKPYCVVDTAVTRLRYLSTLSNLEEAEVFRLAGLNVQDLGYKAVDHLAFQKWLDKKNEEIDKLENFGMKLFENKLPDWFPS